MNRPYERFIVDGAPQEHGHSGRAARDPESRGKTWIPACAGMTILFFFR